MRRWLSFRRATPHPLYDPPNVECADGLIILSVADEFKREVLDPYDKTLTEAIKEFGEAEVEIDFEPISEGAFEKLMSSNDWNFAQAVEIGWLIVS